MSYVGGVTSHLVRRDEINLCDRLIIASQFP